MPILSENSLLLFVMAISFQRTLLSPHKTRSTLRQTHLNSQAASILKTRVPPAETVIIDHAGPPRRPTLVADRLDFLPHDIPGGHRVGGQGLQPGPRGGVGAGQVINVIPGKDQWIGIIIATE